RGDGMRGINFWAGPRNTFHHMLFASLVAFGFLPGFRGGQLNCRAEPLAELPLLAGFAEADITPKLGANPVYMAGFGQNRKATGYPRIVGTASIQLRRRSRVYEIGGGANCEGCPCGRGGCQAGDRSPGHGPGPRAVARRPRTLCQT